MDQKVDSEMLTVRDYSPRRYCVDKAGCRVLVGLTPEETSEFEAIDNLFPLGSSCDRANQGVRWTVLYSKHDEAWKVWAASAYANPPE
jgi:hypothetical protein